MITKCSGSSFGSRIQLIVIFSRVTFFVAAGSDFARSSEWPHVLKLFLRRFQPLAQALDIFIVRLVLLLVHFQQRSQDFDPMLFLHHTLRVFELAYNRTVSGCFQRFTGFYICVWLSVVLGVGEKLFGLPWLLVIDNSFTAAYYMRLLYVSMAHAKHKS